MSISRKLAIVVLFTMFELGITVLGAIQISKGLDFCSILFLYPIPYPPPKFWLTLGNPKRQ